MLDLLPSVWDNQRHHQVSEWALDPGIWLGGDEVGGKGQGVLFAFRLTLHNSWDIYCGGPRGSPTGCVFGGPLSFGSCLPPTVSHLPSISRKF